MGNAEKKPAKSITVWKRETRADQYTYTTKVNISVPAAEGETYSRKTGTFGSITIESFSKGPRGGYQFGGHVGFNPNEWAEIEFAIQETKKKFNL